PEPTENGHGNGEQDDKRQGEALVLSRKSEVHDEEAKAEDDDGLAGRLDFFEGQSCPGEGHTLKLVLVEEPLHGLETLAGAEAGGRGAINLSGAEEVVVIDDLRPGGLVQRDEIIERNHLAGVGANVILADVLGIANIT